MHATPDRNLWIAATAQQLLRIWPGHPLLRLEQIAAELLQQFDPQPLLPISQLRELLAPSNAHDESERARASE